MQWPIQHSAMLHAHHHSEAVNRMIVLWKWQWFRGVLTTAEVHHGPASPRRTSQIRQACGYRRPRRCRRTDRRNGTRRSPGLTDRTTIRPAERSVQIRDLRLSSTSGHRCRMGAQVGHSFRRCGCTLRRANIREIPRHIRQDGAACSLLERGDVHAERRLRTLRPICSHPWSDIELAKRIGCSRLAERVRRPTPPAWLSPLRCIRRPPGSCSFRPGRLRSACWRWERTPAHGRTLRGTRCCCY